MFYQSGPMLGPSKQPRIHLGTLGGQHVERIRDSFGPTSVNFLSNWTMVFIFFRKHGDAYVVNNCHRGQRHTSQWNSLLLGSMR